LSLSYGVAAVSALILEGLLYVLRPELAVLGFFLLYILCFIQMLASGFAYWIAIGILERDMPFSNMLTLGALTMWIPLLALLIPGFGPLLLLVWWPFSMLLLIKSFVEIESTAKVIGIIVIQGLVLGCLDRAKTPIVVALLDFQRALLG